MNNSPEKEFQFLGDGLYCRKGKRRTVYYERPTLSGGSRPMVKLLSLTKKEAKTEMEGRRLQYSRFLQGLAPNPYVKEKLNTPRRSTLGAIFEIYRSKCILQKSTIEGNIGALCSIIRYAKPELKDKTKEEIAELSSSLLTAELMHDFRKALQIEAGNDRLKQDTAAVTANSFRTQARSIFKQEMIQFYRNVAPPTLPEFLAVKKLSEPSKQFRMPDPSLLARIRAAIPELKEKDRNAYRIYLLSACCGLRKGEIAATRWSWISPIGDRYQVHVQTESDFRPKGRRDRILPMEAEVYSELASIREDEADGRIMTGTTTERYKLAFRRFSAWLNSLGWNRAKKAHELRKVFGSVVNQQYGIHAAQVLLGHSSPKVTDQYYVAPANLPEIKIYGT